MPALRQATLACLHKYGERVRFYTSSAAVADLEAVRTALGFTAIDLYAASYGTRVAQLYMRRFPQAAHAVILDGVTYPQQSIGPATPLDGERALNLIVARCLRNRRIARRRIHCSAASSRLCAGNSDRKNRRSILDDPDSGLPLEIEFNRSMLSAS